MTLICKLDGTQALAVLGECGALKQSQPEPSPKVSWDKPKSPNRKWDNHEEA